MCLSRHSPKSHCVRRNHFDHGIERVCQCVYTFISQLNRYSIKFYSGYSEGKHCQRPQLWREQTESRCQTLHNMNNFARCLSFLVTSIHWLNVSVFLVSMDIFLRLNVKFDCHSNATFLEIFDGIIIRAFGTHGLSVMVILEPCHSIVEKSWRK